MKTIFKKNGGFTLVELIVVIAILAILAAVAIPAYSGYIEKANKAGDEQLLAAVNRAFASACSVNADDMYNYYAVSDKDAPKITLKNDANGNKVIDSVSIYGEEFKEFFKGNETSAFKVYTKIVFDTEKCQFVGTEAPTVTYNGVTYVLSQDAIDAFKNSVFFENADDLADNLDILSGAFGVVAGGADSEKLALYFGQDFADFIGNTTDATTIGNKTILYIAGQTEGMTAQDAGDALLKAQTVLANPNATIADLGNDSLTTVAVMYGAVTAYANGTGKNSTTAEMLGNGINNQGELLKLFAEASKDDDFLEYVGNFDAEGNLVVGESFTTDMNGFLGALEAMDSVSGGVTEGDLGKNDLWSNDFGGLLGQLK